MEANRLEGVESVSRLPIASIGDLNFASELLPSTMQCKVLGMKDLAKKKKMYKRVSEGRRVFDTPSSIACRR